MLISFWLCLFIMPNYFLTGTANQNLLIGPVEKPGVIANKQNWKVIQVALTSFWQRWILFTHHHDVEKMEHAHL